jgi:hypothetical protein
VAADRSPGERIVNSRVAGWCLAALAAIALVEDSGVRVDAIDGRQFIGWP